MSVKHRTSYNSMYEVLLSILVLQHILSKNQLGAKLAPLKPPKTKQVIAPKGLDISRPTTLVLPNFFLKGQNQ